MSPFLCYIPYNFMLYYLLCHVIHANTTCHVILVHSMCTVKTFKNVSAIHSHAISWRLPKGGVHFVPVILSHNKNVFKAVLQNISVLCKKCMRNVYKIFLWFYIICLILDVTTKFWTNLRIIGLVKRNYC